VLIVLFCIPFLSVTLKLYHYRSLFCVLLELGIDAKEAVELLQLVRGSKKQHDDNVTALDLLRMADNNQPIVSFSEQLDNLLGGGVALGKMTEFCGAPGIGKTQLW